MWLTRLDQSTINRDSVKLEVHRCFISGRPVVADIFWLVERLSRMETFRTP